jgi:predicted RNase H-like HicB family nuclease
MSNEIMDSIQVIIEKSKTGYSAYIPELPGCVSTGSNVEEIKKNIGEAISFHIEGLNQDKLEIPLKFTGNFILEFSYDVETFLNHYDHVFTRRALSRITGINESLLSQYASGLKHPRKAQAKRIEKGLHELANELLQISL